MSTNVPLTDVTPIQANKVINGKFGRLFLPGAKFVGECRSVEARIALERTDVTRSGVLSVGYKLTGLSGDGTLNLYHVNSEWRTMVANVMKTNRMPEPLYLIIELADKEAFYVNAQGEEVQQFERVRLDGVQFWETSLGFDTGSLVENDIPFTFTGVEYLSELQYRPS